MSASWWWASVQNSRVRWFLLWRQTDVEGTQDASAQVPLSDCNYRNDKTSTLELPTSANNPPPVFLPIICLNDQGREVLLHIKPYITYNLHIIIQCPKTNLSQSRNILDDLSVTLNPNYVRHWSSACLAHNLRPSRVREVNLVRWLLDKHRSWCVRLASNWNDTKNVRYHETTQWPNASNRKLIICKHKSYHSSGVSPQGEGAESFVASP